MCFTDFQIFGFGHRTFILGKKYREVYFREKINFHLAICHLKFILKFKFNLIYKFIFENKPEDDCFK